MKKLRLVLTERCDKKCEGCCMKPPPVIPKPITLDEVYNHSAEEVYLTGGEPMLYPSLDFIHMAENLRKLGKKVYLYSAWTHYRAWYDRLHYLDGVTYTAHDQKGLDFFEDLNWLIKCFIAFYPEHKLSLWFNVFDKTSEECAELQKNYPLWKIRSKVWIKNCPVPEGEDFRKLV